MDETSSTSRSARATAWVFFGFGVLVLVAGVGQLVVSMLGPTPRGCAGMVEATMTIFAVLAAIVVGVPHVVAPIWFLKRPRIGRRVFLGLLVVNALLDALYVVMFATQPSSPNLLGRAPVIAPWSALLAINVVAFWIVLRRGRVVA